MDLRAEIECAAHGLSDALLAGWRAAREDMGDERPCAFALRPWDGFASITCAYDTRERLAREHEGNGLVRWFAKCGLTAERASGLAAFATGEWFSDWSNTDAFDTMSERLRALTLEDDFWNHEDDELYRIWTPLVIGAFEALLERAPPGSFPDDLYLGPVFYEPTGADWDMMIDVAVALDRSDWTTRLRDAKASAHELVLRQSDRRELDRLLARVPDLHRHFTDAGELLLPRGGPLEPETGRGYFRFLGDEPPPFDQPLTVALVDGHLEGGNTSLHIEGRYELIGELLDLEAVVTRATGSADVTDAAGRAWTDVSLHAFGPSRRGRMELGGRLSFEPPRAVMIRLERFTRFPGPDDV